MKKILAFLIGFNISIIPACAITDNFVEASLDKTLKIKSVNIPVITDDFVENSLDKTLKIKKTTYIPLNDEFAQQNKNKNEITIKNIDYQETIPTVSTKKKLKHKKIVVLDRSKMQEVVIRIKEPFTTKNCTFEEGDYIEFETTKDIVMNGKNYPNGTTVKARIETISLNKPWGVPADLIIGNFTIDNIQLAGEIIKIGANRALWVTPAVYAGCLFFGAGLLLIPIRGGHAKLKIEDSFTLYANK